MWFDKPAQIPTIARHTGFSIFELTSDIDFAQILPNSLHVKKAKQSDSTSGREIISLPQIQEIFPIVDAKHSTDFFIVIEEAELMNNSAINAFLKRLEEPNTNVHQIMLTRDISQILPTIRSRAQIYRLKSTAKISDAPNIDPKILSLAKEYLSCTPQQLPAFAKRLSKDSKTARDKSIQVVNAAINLMYKSYFATGNQKFLIKLEQLLQVQAHLANGNLKLQLVAHML